MKWFRSNIRLGSRLSLSALAIQFLLAFGHFHGGDARAAAALMNAKPSELHHNVGFGAWRASASDPVRSKAAHDDPDDNPTHDCAICAVMALAGTLVVATPPCLLAPQAAAFTYLGPDRGFFRLHPRRVAFRSRAPPIA